MLERSEMHYEEEKASFDTEALKREEKDLLEPFREGKTGRLAEVFEITSSLVLKKHS